MTTRISNPHTTLLPILLLITLTYTQSDAPITTINITQNYNTTQSTGTYKYYQLTFNATKRLLLLTLDTNTTEIANIYISVHYSNSNELYFTHPDETNYTQECDQSSFDTCIVRFDNQASQSKQVTVYFSIYATSNMQYKIWAVIDQIYNLNISYNYRIDFSKYESGVLKIRGDQLVYKQEVVMVLSYNTSGLVGKFKAQAAVDQIPNTKSCCDVQIFASTVGAFNKIMKLPPIAVNSTYYLLIQGQKGTKFNLHFVESTPSAPRVEINSSVIYETSENLTYLTHTPFTNTQLPLFIHLDAYSGYGVFKVNYCNGFIKTTFQNINGQNGQIGITSDQRLQCKERIGSQGGFGLLVENIEIEVTNVVYHFGYQIGVYQGIYNTPLRLNEGRYGVFLNYESNRTYPIELTQAAQISIKYQQLTDQTTTNHLLFQLEQCIKRRNTVHCSIILSNSNQTSGDLTFVPTLTHLYNLRISCNTCGNSTSKIQYLVQLIYEYEHNSVLQPYKLYLQQVQANQYKFYLINLTKITDQLKINVKNNSQLTIALKQINGDVYALSSLTVPQPTFQKYMKGNYSSDIVFSWNGLINYLINQTDKLIYLTVKGNEQSLFYLQYSINVDADIPAKYTKLIDGVQNNFILNKTNPYQLLSFTSHIIPFKIYLTNSPKCIKLGYSLPLNQTCITELPSSFSQKVVYMNISHGANPNNFNFGVFINSGNYVLNDRDPILLGCIDTCFEIITVQLTTASNVIHQGRGYIFQVKNVSNQAYNSYLSLKCDNYPCSTKINATLPYGGDMSLFLQSSGIRLISWKASPVTFGDYPKRFIYDLRYWSEFNSILLYSDALQINVYYNIINIKKLDFNTKKYDFPTTQLYDGHHSGNPLRKTQVITIDNNLITAKGCREPNSYCLVAFSLFPNLTIEYNDQYFNSGIGFISSNTYQYYFPLNIPYQINEQFSMSYFAHKKHTDEVDSSVGYRINLQPFSNCHPKLYTTPYSFNPTFEKPSYSGVIVNYTQNWINFTVIAQDECKYRITLTNSMYDIVAQNKFYHLVPANNTVKVLYRSEYSRKLGFNIEVQTKNSFDKVSFIAVKKVNQSLPFVQPTMQNNDFFIGNSYSLSLPENQTYNLYLICISTNSSTIDLIIRKDQPIVLSRNQQDKRTLAKQGILSYRIHATGSIVLFVTTTLQYAMITVNKNQNQTEVKHVIITSRSDPWIYINATSNELTTYDITIRNMADDSSTINILFQLSDVLSFRRIYEGIIVYDAFIAKDEKNCYYFQTPLLLGRKDIVIDLVMGKNDSQFIDYCSTHESCVKLLYAVRTKSSIIKANISVLQTSPTVYRLKFPFIAKQNYTVCFYTHNITAINIEYYILLNDPTMQHLIEDTTTTQVYPKQYDMYEIVQEGYNENIMIEVTSCVNDPSIDKTIVGSASFVDSSLGRYTDLIDYYKTRNSIYAKLSVQEGYYYLGVKNHIFDEQYANAYTIRFQNLSNQGTLMAAKWQLRDSKIFKVYNTNSNKSSYTIQLPEIVNNDDNILQNNISIKYSVYIQNASKNSPTAPLQLASRCPNYQSIPFQGGKQEMSSIIMYNVTYSYQNLTHFRQRNETPKFTFDAETLPKEFNILGRIDVTTNAQSFSFHYQNNKINLNQLNSGEGISGAFIALIIIFILIAIGLGGYVFFVYFKMNEIKTENVEMTQYTNKPVDHSAIEKKIVGKGYGQLVDELQ